MSLSYIAGGISCEDSHTLISENKLNELKYLLRSELRGQKVLVWCRFLAEQAFIEAYLREHHIATLTINGNTEIKKRSDIRQIFINGDIDVCVMTISSSAKGLDWSVADTSIYYSNEFSNDLRSQSEDRTFHPEKNKPALIIDLVTKDSVDEELLALLKEKSFNSRLLMSQLRMKYKGR